jgi:hypothetical protein
MPGGTSAERIISRFRQLCLLLVPILSLGTRRNGVAKNDVILDDDFRNAYSRGMYRGVRLTGPTEVPEVDSKGREG